MAPQIFARAFPVRPGKSDRVGNYEAELAPYRDEFDRLSHEGGFRQICVILQEGEDADTMILAFGLDDFSTWRRAFTDSAYDTWWVEFMKDVTGIDLSQVPPGLNAPPQPVFCWTS